MSVIRIAVCVQVFSLVQPKKIATLQNGRLKFLSMILMSWMFTVLKIGCNCIWTAMIYRPFPSSTDYFSIGPWRFLWQPWSLPQNVLSVLIFLHWSSFFRRQIFFWMWNNWLDFWRCLSCITKPGWNALSCMLAHLYCDTCWSLDGSIAANLFSRLLLFRWKLRVYKKNSKSGTPCHIQNALYWMHPFVFLLTYTSRMNVKQM